MGIRPIDLSQESLMNKQFFLLHVVQNDMGNVGGRSGYQELFPSEEAGIAGDKEIGPSIIMGDQLRRSELVRFDINDAKVVTKIAVKTFFNENPIGNPEWIPAESWKPDCDSEDGQITDDPTIKLDFDNPIVEIVVGQPLKYQEGKLAA